MTSLEAAALRGSYVPVVTPFRGGEVDFEAFEEQVERQVTAGSDGIVVTGTTGEPTSVEEGERIELFRRALDAAAGRIPVVASSGSPNQREALRLTAAATELGVEGVLVVVPAFVRPSQEGMFRHFVTIARSTDLPVLIYNIPGRAAAGIEPATVERIVDAAENLVGLKSALADLDPVTDLLGRLGDEFRLFCGVESLSYPFLALGGAGLMSAVGNLFPERVAALCQAVDAGRHAEALEIHRELFDVNRAIFFDTNPVPLKAMMEILGVGSAEVRPPLAAADEELRSRLEATMMAMAR